MFAFIKKLFGFDEKTLKDAGVQIEQAPYKVEAPVVVSVDPTVNPVVSTTKEEVVVKEVPANTTQAAKETPAEKPKKKPAQKKPSSGGKPRGRKPKAKPASK